MTVRGNQTLRAACVTVLGCGHLRPAPGTWGSLAAVVAFCGLWWLVNEIGVWPRTISGLVATLAILAASYLSVIWGQWALQRYGAKDPKEFVLDEFAGQFLALVWLPPLATAGWVEFGWVVAGQFLLFRILDIIKPPPARQMERWPAGWGILADDLMSGLYALAIGHLIWRLSPIAIWLGLETAGS